MLIPALRKREFFSAKASLPLKLVTVGVPKTPDPNATPKPLEGLGDS